MATERLTNAVAATEKSEKDIAITAALELVSERLAGDAAWQQNFRQRYDELQALVKSKAETARTPVPRPKPASASTPRFHPLAKLNPYDMAERYEHSELRTVLENASQALLREAVDVVQSREPGTRPAGRTKKADMIDYIVEHVIGPGY